MDCRIAYVLSFGLFLLPAPVSADFETSGSAQGIYANQFSTSAVAGIVTLSFGYDENVLLASDTSLFLPPGATRDSFYAALSFDGTWSRPVGPNTQIGLSGEIGGVYYFDEQSQGVAPFADDPSDYSRFVIAPRVFLDHTVDLAAGGRLRLTPSYTFRHEGGADVAAIGLDSHQLRLDASYAPDRKSTFRGHLLYADNDFDVSFPGTPTSERDGAYMETGVSWRIKPVPSRAYTVGAVWQSNDSDGSDYRFDGYKLFAEFETHLGRAFFGTFGVIYADRDYDSGFAALVAEPREDQQILGLSARVLKPLDANRALQLLVQHDSYMSNARSFEGDRTMVELSLIVSLP